MVSGNGPLRSASTVVGLVLALIGPGVVAWVSAAMATRPESVAPRALSLLLFVGLIAVVGLLARTSDGPGFRELGFKRSSAMSVLLAVPLAAFFIFIFGPAAYAALATLKLGSFDTGIAALSELPRWYLALAIVIVAAGEEWLYRGYAIEQLERLTGSTWLAGALSLAAFALVHLPMWGPGPAATTLVSGGVMTILYIWRRDVLMLICAHVATDLWGLL